MSLKMLKKHCPLCRLVVSFADCDQNHLGTIYQATNWIYTGTSGTDYGTAMPSVRIHGKSIHNRTVHGLLKKFNAPYNLENIRKYLDPNATFIETKGKRKYLYPLDKKMREKILPLAKPYPKTDPNWEKIDRSEFKHDEENQKQETEEAK